MDKIVRIHAFVIIALILEIIENGINGIIIVGRIMENKTRYCQFLEVQKLFASCQIVVKRKSRW